MTPWGRLESLYERELVKLLRSRGPINTLQALSNLVESYSFREQADRLARRMVGQVFRANAVTWREAVMRGTKSQAIWRALRREIDETPIGAAVEATVLQNANLIQSLPLDIAQRATQWIATQQQRGLRASEVEKVLRRRLPDIAASRIKLISRTEIGKAEAALTRARSEDIGVTHYQWLTSRDQRVRPSHRNLDLVLVRWDDPPQPEELIGQHSTLGTGHPGEFPYCFVGETIVSSPRQLKKLWRAPYRGDLITFAVGETRFSVTPNHPMLTGNGWLPAHLVNSGDDLIRAVGNGFLSGDANANQGVTSFQDLFLANVVKVKRRTGLPFNFYGDVPDGDVDEIAFDPQLRDSLMPKAAEFVKNLHLAGSNPMVGRFLRYCIAHILEPFTSSLGSDGTSAFGRHILHSDAVLVAGAAPFNSGFLQRSGYSSARYAEGLGNSLFAGSGRIDSTNILTGQVEFVGRFNPSGREPHLDATCAEVSSEGVGAYLEATGCLGKSESASYKAARITDKAVSKFSGQVFTFECGVGWYGVTPLNFIAKNCRCASAPLISLEEVAWPCRVYADRRITRMTRAQFTRRCEYEKAA